MVEVVTEHRVNVGEFEGRVMFYDIFRGCPIAVVLGVPRTKSIGTRLPVMRTTPCASRASGSGMGSSSIATRS
jgi:hypothetical protein